jgi:type 1 glutamine amidotransferase
MAGHVQSRLNPGDLQISIVFLFYIAVQAQDTIRVLHYTETTGYDHNTREVSKALFERICDSLTANNIHTWILTHSDSSEVFDDLAGFQQYNVVIWSNTSGSAGLTTTQRQNFEQYFNAGGSYLGIHAASDTYRHSTANGSNTGVWDFYAEMLSGCSVQENPHHTAQDHNNNLHHSTMDNLLFLIPDPWNKTEEYYYWENGFLDSSFTELLHVDSTGPNSYDAPRMMAHFKQYPWGSRSFYTALGHDTSNYTSDVYFAQLMENALYWTANASPYAGISTLHGDHVQIYPNPFTRELTFEPVSGTDWSVSISDAKGRVVHTGQIVQNTTIDLSFLRSGVYFLTLTSKEGAVTKRVVKL